MFWEEIDDKILLHTPSGFSFSKNLQYLDRSTNECLFLIRDNKIRKAISLETCTTLIEISKLEDQILTIEFLNHTRPESKSSREEVIAYIIEWFDLKVDLQQFYILASTDPILSQASKQFSGLRIMGIPDLFEAMTWGILGQQINLTYAYTLKRRLVETYGHSIHFEGHDYWLFPTPDTIAYLTVQDLSGLKMTVKKCEYLIEVANLIYKGVLTKEMLLVENDVKKAEKILTQIRGIGPWTANYVLMRCLRFPSAFPIDDVGLHNAIKQVNGAQTKPTKSEIMQLAQHWTGWEAYATFYLWRLLY
ncbi:DNA-3-methyladenine glycosylase 2 family protein [Psychrobacillus sp. INOP01]|uniref:DNA-3-methyladenine glycosylase family protein n=1 Tax=Psychrobacillus sp. INOP01 TaxID=2829187 RepID=UPI001BA901BF|nr:DNA-3-methyladenine glycosylase [Psychrobacillus sp. INOP01]QUG43335.1 DNA-3-methyladenine glycosylase 2 family protein [Psychrobacillus sp. INOP01]